MQVTVQTPSERRAAPKTCTAGQDRDQESCSRSPSTSRAEPQTGACSWGPTLGHLLMGISFCWTPCALCCGVSWEVFHRHGVWQGTDMGFGCSGRVTQGGAGASLSLGHRALCCTLVNLPHLFPRANALFWGHSLPCKVSDPLFFQSCMAWGHLWGCFGKGKS